MSFKVIFSDEAISTFQSIEQQIQDRWSEKEANEFRKRTYSVVDIISVYPYTFRAIDETSNVRKAFIYKNCSMFYFIGENYIEILFFWDNRQEPMI